MKIYSESHSPNFLAAAVGLPKTPAEVISHSQPGIYPLRKQKELILQCNERLR